MARKKSDDPIFDKANKLIDDMNEQIRVIATQEGFKAEALRVIVGVPDGFVSGIFKRGYRQARSYNILSLLRLLDFFGYDIMLVKRRETYKWGDDPDIQSRIFRYNNYNLTRKDKRSKTHQKNERKDIRHIDDGKPKQIEIRTVRKPNGALYDLARSKGVSLYTREDINKAKCKDDFFGLDGSD